MANGLYTIHSFFVPHTQENFTLNYCWRALNGDLIMRQYCHVFIAKIPALYKRGMNTGYETISFESVCLPGFYIRQKNYHFIVDERDGTDLFGEIFG